MSHPRPLSPHLQVYRFQSQMMLSITHRISGVALCAGALALLYWVLALASGPERYAQAVGLFGSTPGLILQMIFSLALFYHLANGIRHLFWDAGRGYQIDFALKTGWVVVAAALLMTAILWFLILS